jgi:hypothetical protein
LLEARPRHLFILGEDREYTLCHPGFVPEPCVLEVLQNDEEVFLVELIFFISKVQMKSDVMYYLLYTDLQTFIPFSFIKVSELKLAVGGHLLP